MTQEAIIKNKYCLRKVAKMISLFQNTEKWNQAMNLW